MESGATLSVAQASGSQLLFTSDGEPVWPVRSETDIGDLDQLAVVFGARLSRVAARVGPAQAGDGHDVVLGLGPEAFEAAELYAHLTRRSLLLVHDVAAAHAELGSASVVVALSERISYGLLERLSVRAPGHPVPGIIMAPGQAALHRQVLMRSAAATLRGPTSEPRIDIAPTMKRSRRRRTARVLQEGASTQQVRDAVRAGAGLLNLMTHSDGVDSCLGPTTLCPMESVPATPGEAPPPCIVRGFCHRHAMTLPAATTADFLIRPREISARLLVLHTCKGALPSESLVDPKWGLLPRLLDQPTIGAVATTWEMTLLVEQDLDRVAAPLLSGLPVGEALAHFLNLSAVRKRNLRMCLFGDPRMQLPASGAGTTGESRLGQRHHAGSQAFIEAYMHFQKGSKLPQAPALIRQVEKCLKQWNAAGGVLADAEGKRTREALLDLICYFGSTPCSDWSQFAKIARSFPSRSPCPQCANQTQTWIMRVQWKGGPQRRMVNCPRCGFVNDSPVDGPQLELRMKGTVLHLMGPRPQRAWSARVMIDPGLPTGEEPRRRWQSWPAGPDGLPVRSFDVGNCVEPWPMNISLFLVENISLTTLTCRVRQPT